VADLREYRRKRDASRTPEPVPEAGPLPRGDDDVFVIQEHHARRLHYDVRLERHGVLVSWAVPKGLPREPGTIRLAVHTEDHPMEYAQFEGDIPTGEYGAGQMSIWDRGTYETVKWQDDEVEVVFHGERVEGAFVFFRKKEQPGWNTRGGKDDWMVRRKGERAKPSEPVTVRVEDRNLRLTNLEKVLYPDDGFTKGQVIDYYRRVAPVLLPHLADRPVTFRRYPNGVEGNSFFEKDVSRHAPVWVRTVRLETPGSTTEGREYADFPVLDGLPALIWASNLAALELHVPQWTVGPRGARRNPDLVVFDLDPGTPATVVECARVAELINEVLAEDGLAGYPKTSGSKGLQVYVPVKVGAADRTSRYAKAVANRLAKEHPDLVVAVMAKQRRTGKVFVDWDQNRPAKTTVAPYSLRARDHPTVSTPVTWREIARCREPEDLIFVADEVAERVERDGDPLADMHANAGHLPR
jgi:DNA ligase D-like protein (predicted polymerase)/DNA ligase D-like protein (predicted 3'-phosphoesterase)